MAWRGMAERRQAAEKRIVRRWCRNTGPSWRNLAFVRRGGANQVYGIIEQQHQHLASARVCMYATLVPTLGPFFLDG